MQGFEWYPGRLQGSCEAWGRVNTMELPGVCGHSSRESWSAVAPASSCCQHARPHPSAQLAWIWGAGTDSEQTLLPARAASKEIQMLRPLWFVL